MGPMTGRAAGFCAGYGVPGYTNQIPGRGFGGMGRGFGGRGGRHGRRNQFFATGLTGWQRAAMGWFGFGSGAPTAEQEIDALNAQAEHFQDALDDIRKRIEELHKEKKNG